MKITLALRSFLLASSALLSIPSALATSYYWDADGLGSVTTGGTGNWDIASSLWRSGSSAGSLGAWTNLTTDTAVFGGTAGAVTLTAPITVGGLTFTTAGYTINTDATNKLTFGATNNAILFNSPTNATITGTVAGTGNVSLSITNQAVLGTLTLNGTSAGGWSGTTTINSGMKLALSDLNQGLLNTTGITLNNGGITLTSADSDAEKALDRVSNAAITSNGGTITYTTTTAGSTRVFAETIGSVALTSGQLNIYETLNKTAGTQTLTLGGLTHTGASNTSVITFSSGNNRTTINMIKVAGATTTPAGQIIGPWATLGAGPTGQSVYAVYDASGNVAVQTVSNSAETAWTTAANAYTTDVGGTVTLTATRTITALRNAGASTVLTLASGANLETFGLLNGAAPTTSLFTVAPGTGGVLTTASGGGNLYVTTGTGPISITAPINNNSGNVTLVKSGAASSAANGTLTLSGNNGYSGGTVINAGTIYANHNNALGNAAGAVTIQAGAGNLLRIGNGVTISNNLTINGGGTAGLGVLYVQDAESATYAGDITITNGANAGGHFGSSSPTATGALELTGKVTYTGGQVVVRSGAVTFSNASNDFSSLSLSQGTVKIGVNNGITAGATMSMGLSGAATFDLNGKNQSLAGVTKSTNAATITNNGGADSTLTITGTSTFGGVVQDGGTNKTALTVNSSGTFTLSGANTYTGATTVTNGSLVINGAVASTSLVVNGSLGGSGTMANATLSGSGSINPGNSPGIMTASVFDPTLNLGAKFEFTAAGTDPTWSSAGDSGNDVLRLTGASPFTGTLDIDNVINIYLNAGALTLGQTFTGGFYTDRNVSFRSDIENAAFKYLVATPGGGTTYNGIEYAIYGGSYTFGVNTVQVSSADFVGGAPVTGGYVSQFTVIPEPGAVLLGGLGLLALLRRRR